MSNKDENYYGDSSDSLENTGKNTADIAGSAAKQAYRSTKSPKTAPQSNHKTDDGTSPTGKKAPSDNEQPPSSSKPKSSANGNANGAAAGGASNTTAGAAGGAAAAGTSGATAGAAGGAAAAGSSGAAAGAAAGTVVPVAGNIVGAAVGGAAGTAAGAAGGAAAGGAGGAAAGGAGGTAAGGAGGAASTVATNAAQKHNAAPTVSSETSTGNVASDIEKNPVVATAKGCLGLVLAILFFGMVITGALAELLPNVITKPVATSVAIGKGIYETVKGWLSGFLDFFTGGGKKDDELNMEINDLNDATKLCVEIIKRHMDEGYNSLQDEIESLCAEKGWDVEATMSYMRQNGGTPQTTDYAFIIAVYSVSTDFDVANIQEFKKKLDDSINITYSYAAEEKITTVTTPYDFHQFNPEMSINCYNEYDTYDDEGNYEDTVHEGVDYEIFYDSGETAKRSNGTDWLITDPNGETIPNYVRYIDKYGERYKEWVSDSSCHRLGDDVYIIDPDQPEIVVKPSEDKSVTYGEITFQAFDNEDVYGWFGVDPDAVWKKIPDDPTYKAAEEFSDGEQLNRVKITYRDMVKMRMDMMQGQISQALSAGAIRYDTYGLTSDEILSYLNALPEGTSGNQKQVIKTALSLVGMVPYYFGGKPNKTGWNNEWWSTITPDYKGRDKDGLDCSGYVQWVFATAGFNGGALDSSISSTGSIRSGLGALKSQIKFKSDIIPGDIGVGQTGVDSWHTGIYLGNNKWVHCSSSGGQNGGGTVIISDSYNAFNMFFRYHPEEMSGDNLYTQEIPTYGSAGANFGCTASETDILLACVIQENDTEQGMTGVAEVMRNRATSANVCLWTILTQKGQYGSYLHGDYKRIGSYTTKSGRKGNRLDELAEHPEKRELITQVFSGAKSLFNNPKVVFQVTHGVKSPSASAKFYCTLGEDYYTSDIPWTAKDVHGPNFH